MNTPELIKTNEFWQESRAFFDARVLRIVYSAETFVICNMSNYAYVTFDLVKLSPGMKRYGLRTTINQVKSMVEDEGYFIRWLAHMRDTDTWRKRLVALDEPALDWMRQLKSQTDQNGPTDRVDLNYENQLFQRNIPSGR